MPDRGHRGALESMADWDAPNVAAAVVDAGHDDASETFGDQDHVFALASVTKLLTAYGCLVAVEEGTLDLDEPVEPQGTVRHLLAHAAGYGFDTGVLMPPERKRVYSNTGFDALAHHLTARAGIPAGAYVEEAVLQPLGMASTAIEDRSLAHGADSTAADMTLFAAELLRPTLVHPDTMLTATSVAFGGLVGTLPGFGTQDPNDWGLGFEIRDQKSPHWTGSANSPGTFGHFGAAGTFLWVDPVLNRALVVLTDRAFGPWAADAWPVLSDAVAARPSGPRRAQ